jgi:hypothetical protein
MRELVDLAAVERLFELLALLLPLLGLGIGAALQFSGRRPGALVTGFLLGLLGPANWLLWHIFNGIEDHYGLDSVKAMLINLALFAALGIGVGLAIRLLRRSGDTTQGPSSDPEHLKT